MKTLLSKYRLHSKHKNLLGANLMYGGSFFSEKREPDHWDGDRYKENSTLQYVAAMNLIDQHIFQGNEIILDIGCGDGRITKQLALRAAKGKVLGIDNSKSMVETAKKNNLENLEFKQIDAQYLKFNKEFDLITSMFCLQWVPNKRLAFRGISTALKSNGTFIAIMPLRNQITNKIRHEMINQAAWQSYFLDFSDTSDYLEDCNYKDYAEAAGLEVSFCKVEPVTTYFVSKEKLIGFFTNITPHLVRLPTDKEKRLFMQQMIELYLKQVPPKEDGSCYVTFQYVTMLAKCPKLALEERAVIRPKL